MRPPPPPVDVKRRNILIFSVGADLRIENKDPPDNFSKTDYESNAVINGVCSFPRDKTNYNADFIPFISNVQLDKISVVKTGSNAI